MDYLKTDCNLDEVSGSLTTETFSHGYFPLVKSMVNSGKLQKSRNGDTIEILNFKTTITNPKIKTAGGYGRNINVFFLLYEAIWIWLGEKNVKPLTIFNARMSDFSDNGEVFHAPYGFRLRHYGLPSDHDLFLKQCQEQGLNDREVLLPPKDFKGLDQLKNALVQLSKNEEDRRVVMSIWNPVLDSDFRCKDLPCNDMVMLKIRDGRLHITIQNRSNDVHWGLPTNVFQFGFLLECMAVILGKELGTQVHNSQSLHVYLSNPTTLTMLANEKTGESISDVLGENSVQKMDYGFREGLSVEEKYADFDKALRRIYEGIIEYHDNDKDFNFIFEHGEVSHGICPSVFFTVVTELLKLYVDYKKEKNKDDDLKIAMIGRILKIGDINFFTDLKILAINFFVARITDKKKYANNFTDKNILNYNY